MHHRDPTPNHRLKLTARPVTALAVIAGGRGLAPRLAVIGCAIVSLGVEATQLCFEDRFCSVSDWITNSLGAAVGVYLARRLTTSVFASGSRSAQRAGPARIAPDGTAYPNGTRSQR